MSSVPSRLHHTAYVTKDLEATRHFYEDILGIPLSATWCETDFLFGKDRTYCHCFFEIGDGGCLAFFQFADPEDQALFDPDLAPSPFRHIALNVDEATQAELEARIQKPGLQPPQTYTLEHGYCRSVYVEDPNGMVLEFTCDDPRAAAGAEERRANAHAELKRWLAGNHNTNNQFRHAEAAE
jgi:catechol 2,3-dioxygenase-like lactoylglutathione lyase family enzyme